MARKKQPNIKNYASMSELERQEVHLYLCQNYTEACFRDALRTGAVDPVGKSDPELHLELLEYVSRHLDKVKEAGDISWIIDHTLDLLKEARRYLRRRKYHLAILFYATWSEHWLNSLVQTVCQQKNLSNEACEQLIRDTPFRAKATWVLQLADMPPLPSQELGMLTELQNLRNGFVHYKFVPRNEDALKQHNHQIQVAAMKSEKLVLALTAYEDKYIFKQSRKKAVRLAKVLGEREAGNPTPPQENSSDTNSQDLPTESHD